MQTDEKLNFIRRSACVRLQQGPTDWHLPTKPGNTQRLNPVSENKDGACSRQVEASLFRKG